MKLPVLFAALAVLSPAVRGEDYQVELTPKPLRFAERSRWEFSATIDIAPNGQAVPAYTLSGQVAFEGADGHRDWVDSRGETPVAKQRAGHTARFSNTTHFQVFDRRERAVAYAVRLTPADDASARTFTVVRFLLPKTVSVFSKDGREISGRLTGIRDDAIEFKTARGDFLIARDDLAYGSSAMVHKMAAPYWPKPLPPPGADGAAGAGAP